MNDQPEEGAIEPYPTDQGAGDWVHGVAKGALSGVPFAGGVLAEVTSLLWTPRLQKRRDEWLQDLAETVENLRQKYDDIAERLDDDAVLTVAVRAARAAASTHEEEKRKALRNAVLNSALRVEPDIQIQQILTELIDRLTEAHLQMLAFVADPSGWYERNGLEKPSLTMGSVSALLEKAFPRWNKEFYRLIADDLVRLGLMNDNLNTIMTGAGVWGNQATGLGRRLLRFITEPE
ncbi:MAG TPA: hypothetical protein VHJ34_13120 [Actinomycetota bacterium]|nr:hypothetical protein [Actinomycetota bacterium]